MKNKHSQAVDGFVPRRRQEKEPRKIQGALSSSRESSIKPVESQSEDIQADSLKRSGKGLSRSDIDESLKSIDNDNLGDAGSARKVRRTHPGRRKIIKRLILGLLLIGLLLAGWMGVKLLIASGNIFKGDVLGLIQQKELKKDANGRSNVLILGTSEDDEGHEGATLTDSLMVVSIDQAKKDAYMISIPRDLYVKYGMACNAGYEGKINEYFNCVNDDWNSEDAETERLTASRKFFGDILGLDIQYSVHVNYTVMRDLVKAVDGITVKIESRNKNGILDSNFDWKCGKHYERVKNCPPRGHFIDFPNGEVHLDAERALYLAQARGVGVPTYGLEESNFDREKNQQKILVALKDKAVSTGTLSNFGKVTGIIDALGNNLRSNVDTSEIRTVIDLGLKIPNENIKSISFVEEGKELMGTSNYGGISVVAPTAGVFNYSELQAYIKRELAADAVTKEAAKVVVLNGSGIEGKGKQEADKLEAMGVEILAIDNSPLDIQTGNTVYQLSTKKPATTARLEKLYSTKPSEKPLPFALDQAEGADYVIIVGKPKATE